MMNWLYRRLRPLLFLLEPELAHGLVGAFLRAWSRLAPAPRAIGISLAPPLAARLRQTLLGIRFDSPIGLAAGLDKGSVLAPACFRLGFGFVEIGSMTPRPQSGNPRPRMFRIPRARALINRMGFNNDGLALVSARLARLPRQPGPVGINLGKNKDTPNEQASDDYIAGIRALSPYADYFAINVSSPNTPGLRDLQSAAELSRLIQSIVRVRNELAAQPGARHIPIFVKLSPDESDESLGSIARGAKEWGADGLIATNTTLARTGVESEAASAQAGGLSGEPLRARALAACKLLYRETRGTMPIIGVGGIATAQDAYARIRAGASLVQLYSSLVFEGPSVAGDIAKGLSQLLERDGLTLPEAIGRDAALE